MSGRGKVRSPQHLIDERGQELLRKSLPGTWVLRDYKPDYGLDFSLETFRVRRGDDGLERLETFGEHLFIQLKSTESLEAKPYKIYGRYNVEKGPEVLNGEDLAGTVDTLRFALETPELVTVQRMGAAVPVLLVIADLAASACYFVCLNDYIDKILIPRLGDYSSADTRMVHVPTLNRVDADPVGPVALRWYAKRAKLYAAFAKFHFQHVELQYAFVSEEFERLAGYFAQIIRRYDFWDDMEMWSLIDHYGRAVQRYAETGRTGTTQRRPAELFVVEREHLLGLPSQRWEPVVWREAKVHTDTHVQVARAMYSVPWRLVGKPVLIRLTKHSVEIYWDDVRVATHARQQPGKRSTVDAHLPEIRCDFRHRSRDFWEQRADALGEDVGAYIREVFDADDVLSQLRTVQSIVTHLETFPVERARATCRRASFYGLHSYGGIKNILRKGLDLEPLPIVVQRQSGVLEPRRFTRDIGELLQLPLEKTDAPN